MSSSLLLPRGERGSDRTLLFSRREIRGQRHVRYVPAPDQNASLRARIETLAHRHRRHGAGEIFLKLRQAGGVANHKRVDRLYTEARLQVKRRRRKKVPHADRQPLVRPSQPNEVWSADFVFDRTAEGRVLSELRQALARPLTHL